MNYIKIMGGLGNQLFEYVFSKYIELVSGKASVLYTDVYNTDYEKRTLGLDKFSCEYIEVTGPLLCERMILETEIPDDLRVDKTFFAGYWQDKKYYNEVRDQILGVISLKQEYMAEYVRQKAQEITGCRDSVAMHIRRGDFLKGINTQVFVLQTMDYYRNALRRIIDILGYKPTVYAFSEDYEYLCVHRDEMEGCPVIPMEPQKDYEDLYLMSCATHHIIANSTFSWWSAAMAKVDGITIMPGKWYLDREDPDLRLDDWIMI